MLCVGTQHFDRFAVLDAKRPGMHSHVKRGNDLRNVEHGSTIFLQDGRMGRAAQAPVPIFLVDKPAFLTRHF